MASTTTGGNKFLTSPDVKQEIVRDEDILLFTQAEMDEFSGDTSSFQIVEELVNNREAMTDPTSFNIQGFDEGQVNQLLSAENFAKYHSDLTQICKLEPNKNDNCAHYVKYKMLDGKHSKVWECGICSKEFGHQYTLMRHLPTHTDERKFQCNTCGKAFRQMSTLSQHRAIHSSDRPYVCEVCHKTFNRVSTLISHRKTHTGLKPHRCHLCNKAFHQKGNLRNHIFTHTNERPYKCDICSKGFNQMSNLMCHKVKAHQRADKPRYVCQMCGKDFQKRVGLRNHEQYQHGVQDSSASIAPTRIKYTNGVLVDPITTAAMQHALATNQTPFALLRPLNGIPVLVRVLAAGDKQMLVPATADDLKKHGQITITAGDEAKREMNTELPGTEQSTTNSAIEEKPMTVKSHGSTVQIKIPVVATVIQRCDKDGSMCMAVQSPGPNTDGMMSENYVFTTTTNNNNNNMEEATSIGIGNFPQTLENGDFNGFTDCNNIQASTQIQYLDECGNLLGEEETKHSIFSDSFELAQASNAFANDLQLENNVINLSENHQDMLQEMGTENIMNITYVDDNAPEQIFEVHQPKFSIPIYLQILEKPQVISLSDADNILDPSNVLYNDTDLNDNFVMV